MPRKNKNAGRKLYESNWGFDLLTKKLGLTPKQKIIMRRYILLTSKNLKGGETN